MIGMTTKAPVVGTPHQTDDETHNPEKAPSSPPKAFPPQQFKQRHGDANIASQVCCMENESTHRWCSKLAANIAAYAIIPGR